MIFKVTIHSRRGTENATIVEIRAVKFTCAGDVDGDGETKNGEKVVDRDRVDRQVELLNRVDRTNEPV